jgi:hypothetical protein
MLILMFFEVFFIFNFIHWHLIFIFNRVLIFFIIIFFIFNIFLFCPLELFFFPLEFNF